MMAPRASVLRWLFLALVATGLISATAYARRPITAISGVVWDESSRPVAGAIVRVKGRDTKTTSDSSGRFELSHVDAATRVRLTAWREGFYIKGLDVQSWSAPVVIRLSAHTARDHSDYQWAPPSVEHSPATRRLMNWSFSLTDRVAPSMMLNVADRFTTGCRDCHSQIVDQWSASAHAFGAANPRFLTLYNGTSVSGARSPVTRYAADRDYGRVPLRPDPATDHGPGFRLDYPGSAGNCASCHLPSAALDHPFDADPNRITGVEARGTHCDFCHKIQGVSLDAKTGLPHADRPGVLSLRVIRPPAGSQLVFGPYDDVDAGRDTKAAAMKESALCGACHQASFWGVPIYESFAEWKASAYADEGRTCQSCHMKPDGVTTNFAPHRGGVTRAAATIATHRFEGAMSSSLLQSAARLTIRETRSRDLIRVDVTVENTGAGHRLPTDSPLRAMLLTVTATGDDGVTVPLVNGPVLPVWAGDLAAQPGLYFAKVLEQLWTGVTPTAAYWTQTRIVEDTRLNPRASVTGTFEFRAPRAGGVTLSARLVLRRAPFELMRVKGWQTPDVEMARAFVRSSLVKEVR